MFGLGAAALGNAATAAFDPLVRVHLARFFEGAGALSVSSSAGFSARMTAKDGSDLGFGLVTPDHPVTVEALALGSSPTAADLQPGPLFSNPLCSLRVGEVLILTPTTAGGTVPVFTLQADGAKPHRYRGALRFIGLAGGRLCVIDTLPLDDYLKGVVGPEIGATVALEAMKAQAIAARTYAIKNFGKCASDGGDADLDDTTRSQAYLGYDAENWRTRTAVDRTAGKIMTYEGIPIDAVYATDCGGMTAEGDAPYLKPVADADCAQETPWTVSVSFDDLQTALGRIGVHNLGEIGGVKIEGKDDSGRVASLEIDGTDGQKLADVSAVQLRKAIGYDRLRSTMFDLTVDDSNKACDFIGRGWGHGLGMCQRGAVAMAASGGADCVKILMHYYSGIEITDLTSDFLQQDNDIGRDQAGLRLSAGASGRKLPGAQYEPATLRPADSAANAPVARRGL